MPSAFYITLFKWFSGCAVDRFVGFTSIDRLRSAQGRILWEHDKAGAAPQGGLYLRRRT